MARLNCLPCVTQVLDDHAVEEVTDPFMGWEGWPPTNVVIVTAVLYQAKNFSNIPAVLRGAHMAEIPPPR